MNWQQISKFTIKHFQKIAFGLLFGFVFVLGVNQMVAFLQNSWNHTFEQVFKRDWTLFFATLASIVGVLGFLINVVDTKSKKNYEKEQMDIAKLSNKAVIVPESVEDAYFLRGENNGRNIFELVEIIPKIGDDEDAKGWRKKVYDISKGQLIFSIVNIGNGLAKDLELALSTSLNFDNSNTVKGFLSYLDKSAHTLFYKTNEAKLKNISFKKDLFLKIRYESAYIKEEKTEEVFRFNITKNKIVNFQQEIYYIHQVQKIKNPQLRG
jgi:hypothetical protein